MKRFFILTSVTTLLLAVMINCSMFGLKKENIIIGKWNGYHSQGAHIVFVFNDDNTMKCMVMEDSQYDFTAHYTVDYSTQPVRLSLSNITPSDMLGNACSAIIKFGEDTTMVFNGNFSSFGTTEYPETFDDMSFGYIEFEKSTE